MESYKSQALIVAEGPNQGASYPLQDTLVTLGRAADNTIVLDSANVSRYHAQIRVSPSGATIEDLGSTNGTWINRHRVWALQPLIPGDLIRLADYVTFRYVLIHPADDLPVTDPPHPQAVQWYGQEPDYDQPESRVSEDSDYDEPHADRSEPSTDRRSYPTEPASPRGPEDVARRGGPQWLYAVIVLLIILLCLCVATAVYVWFAPMGFWEWLFNLFRIPLPTV